MRHSRTPLFAWRCRCGKVGLQHAIVYAGEGQQPHVALSSWLVWTLLIKLGNAGGIQQRKDKLGMARSGTNGLVCFHHFAIVLGSSWSSLSCCVEHETLADPGVDCRHTLSSCGTAQISQCTFCLTRSPSHLLSHWCPAMSLTHEIPAFRPRYKTVPAGKAQVPISISQHMTAA